MNDARLVVVGAGISVSPPSLRSWRDPGTFSVPEVLNCVLLPTKDNREL